MSSNRMLAINCAQTASGDIRTRQPKSPGAKPEAYNRPRSFYAIDPRPTFANSVTKDKTGETFRCCHCGDTFLSRTGGAHTLRR